MIVIVDYGMGNLRSAQKGLEKAGVDAVIMRHEVEGSSHFAAQILKPIVINAGDGAHEHPTQGLLDMFTVLQYKNRIEGLKVVIVGDILHSRVARSNIWGMKALGADVHVAGPTTLLAREMECMGITVHTSVEEAIEAADVINVLRIQKERQGKGLFPSSREYARLFGINARRLKMAKPDALLMHPGPMNRGLEISPDVAYSEQSAIQEQVKNGLAIRMAILYLVLMGGENIETSA